ncbi:MAG: hypothetical protein ABIR71_13620 [Chthoniobacterales bacterium]
MPRKRVSETSDLSKVTIRNIATIPFSQLYDILRAATSEQRMAWARELEQMPSGLGQRVAVAAYYKSLIQVDHRAAIEGVLHAGNLRARDVAIDAMTKAAPESTWGDLAEMLEELPFAGSVFGGADLFGNWSRVDPVAVSEFIEKYPLTAKQRDRETGDDWRMSALIRSWGEIDPAAARSWLEDDASRQTQGVAEALLTSWGRVDRAGAIEYAVAKAGQPQFASAINELVYQFIRFAGEDATRLLAVLPTSQAQAAVKNVAAVTSPLPEEVNGINDRGPEYQRPPEEVAHWMITLPLELWQENIGPVAAKWMDETPDAAKAWLNQLPPASRDTAIASCCHAAVLGYHSREPAIEIGLTISDARLRDAAVGALVRRLETSVPGAISASRIINELSVSEQQKAYLRTFITGKPYAE